MARINQGILGGFSGKAGTVVGSSWKGRSVMRGLPQVKKNSKSSQDKLNQREKFKLMVEFFTGLADMFAITYRKQAKDISGFNAAVSANIRNAISGVESPFSIDLAKLQFGYANGNLPNGLEPKVSVVPAHQISFSWQNNAGFGKAKASDIAIGVVYCPAQKQAISFPDMAIREDETATIALQEFAGELVETWILFLSEDEKLVSPTLYTGQVTRVL